MKRNNASVFFISFFCVLVFAFFCMCYAADSLGQYGGQVVGGLGNLLQDNTAAMTIYTLLLTIIGIVCRVMLKRLPTVIRGIAGKVVWSALAGLFGDGVVMDNNKDMEFVKDRLKKKYPLLQIEIKK